VTTAFMFPGQGVGQEGTFRLWYVGSRAVRRLVDRAAHYTGVSSERFFARGARALESTDLLQPVLTAVVLGISEELETRGVRPDIVAGHSLGEIAAVAAAGCVDADGAIRLAAERGRLMAREATRHPGSMVALAVSSPEQVLEALALAREHGIAAMAAHNAPGCWVISGEREPLRALTRRFGARPLSVAGPWHSAAMSDAVEEFRAVAHRIVTHEVEVPLVCNRSGRVVERAEEIPDLLAEQLTQPIEWVVTMETMRTFGVREFVIPGPGKVIRGLVRQNLGPEVAVRTVDHPEHLESLRAAVAR
jgi:[acyl-carrier-protein] S-malonyltransferase